MATALLIVSIESQKEMYVLLDDNAASSSVVLSHDRSLGIVIRELDVHRERGSKSNRRVISRHTHSLWRVDKHTDKQNEYADQHGCKNNEHLSVQIEGLYSSTDLSKTKFFLLPGYISKYRLNCFGRR